MRIAFDVERSQMLEGQTAPIRLDRPREDETPEDLGNFKIEEVRCMERDLLSGDACGHTLPYSGSEQ